MIGLGLRKGNVRRGASLPAGLTSGYSLYLESNDTEPLNTANQIEGVSGGGSYLAFDDLTGITITATVGTAVMAINGNNIEVTTTGTLRRLELSNGDVFTFSKGSDTIVYSENGNSTATLNGFTWTQGVDTDISDGTQTALMSWNKYTNHLTYSNIFHATYSNWGKLNGGRITGDRTITDPLGGTTASTLQFRYANPLSAIFQVGTAFTDDRIVKIWAKSNDVVGKKFRIRVDGTDAPQTSDDFTTSATWQEFEFEVTGNGTSPVNIYITNEAAGVDGYIDIWRANFHDKNEPSEYIETLATPIINAVIPENTTDLGNDVLGNVIDNPLLVDGYNFSGNNTYLDTSILDRTVAGSDGIWIKKTVSDLPMVICGDDVMEIRINTDEILEVEFNGVTLVSNQIISNNVWYFVKFTQDGAINGEIYIGKEGVAPTLNAYGTVGAATAASTVLTFGK